MNRERLPHDDEEIDDDDHTDAVVAADDTGLVQNEINIVQVEMEPEDTLPA